MTRPFQATFFCKITTLNNLLIILHLIHNKVTIHSAVHDHSRAKAETDISPPKWLNASSRSTVALNSKPRIPSSRMNSVVVVKSNKLRSEKQRERKI